MWSGAKACQSVFSFFRTYPDEGLRKHKRKCRTVMSASTGKVLCSIHRKSIHCTALLIASRVLRFRRPLQVARAKSVEDRRHVLVKELLQGLAACLFKGTCRYERRQEQRRNAQLNLELDLGHHLFSTGGVTDSPESPLNSPTGAFRLTLAARRSLLDDFEASRGDEGDGSPFCASEALQWLFEKEGVLMSKVLKWEFEDAFLRAGASVDGTSSLSLSSLSLSLVE